jgi:nitroreductase
LRVVDLVICLSKKDVMMDIFELIRSLRAVRHFTNQPIPEDVLIRILEAGRWTGSAKNTQPWQFIVVRQRETLEQLAECGSYGSHLKGAALAVVIVTDSGNFGSFDEGRCAQSMMLAAWGEGVGSCIATLHKKGCANTLLEIPQQYNVQTAISFGYSQSDPPRTIEGRPREEILASLGRRPLQEILHWEKWQDK